MIKQSITRVISIVMVLALFSSVFGLLMWQSDAYAQDPPSPTPALDPVHRANVELTEAQISNVRSLPIAPVNRQAVNREALDVIVLEIAEERYTRDDALSDQYFYEALGLLPTGVDLYAIGISTVTQAPTDFYDPTSNTIYVLPIPTGVLNISDTMRYGENYAYALLEDQFGAFTLLNSIDNPDQYLAIQAVIQADAQLTLEQLAILLVNSGTYSLDTMLRQAATYQGRDLPGSPPSILVEEAYFGSEVGLAFVRGLYEETGTWRLVDNIYARPPLSTEHLLHPTLYLLYEEPHQVAIAPMDVFLAGQDDNWQFIQQRTVGEFYLRQHLGLLFDQTVTDEMASGWGGDTLQLFANDEGQVLMVWRISWDTQDDFVQFTTRYGEFIGSWLQIPGVPYDNGAACWEGLERSLCFVELDDDILIVGAPTDDMALAALQYQLNILSGIFG